jgi:hypothetical protein
LTRVKNYTAAAMTTTLLHLLLLLLCYCIGGSGGGDGGTLTGFSLNNRTSCFTVSFYIPRIIKRHIFLSLTYFFLLVGAG